MTERTRRASDALDIHSDYWNHCYPGSPKGRCEDPLLDPAQDPTDVRHGQQDWLYPEHGSFQATLKADVGNMRTYVVTTELWDAIIDYKQDLQHCVFKESLPASSGFLVAPYGIKVPDNCWLPSQELRDFIEEKGYSLQNDVGAGAEWWIDGFMWYTSDRVAVDEIEPQDGVVVIPLTNWRGSQEHRPFYLMKKYLEKGAPALAASDLTAWGFGVEPEPLTVEVDDDDEEGFIDREQVKVANEMRAWFRDLVWSAWECINNGTHTVERGDRGAERRARKMPGDHEVVVVDSK